MPRTKKKVKSIVKTKVISARVTETVHELLYRQAEDAGMTLSQFAAQMLMKGRVNTSYVFYVHPDEIEAITREFAAIGNNLNQIAAFFNSGGIPVARYASKTSTMRFPAFLKCGNKSQKWQERTMAILKHIASKSSNYGAALEYLIFKHDELRKTPILDQNGNRIMRDEFYLDGLNCEPYSFDAACQQLNREYQKNKNKNEIKSHHYIISFDPRDSTENCLTGKRAQELGLEYAKANFPGHQALVCTHMDGHNGSGNIHVHIVINSLRKLDVPQQPFMERPIDCKAGYKHHVTNEYLKHLQKSLMDLCRREFLHQVDLLSPSRTGVTEAEYWAQRRLDEKKQKIETEGFTPNPTKFQTQKQLIRDAVAAAREKAISYEDFQDILQDEYNIFVKTQRGRYSYLPPERNKFISERSLGDSCKRECLEGFFVQNAEKNLRYKEEPILIFTTRTRLRLVVDLQENVKAQENLAYALKVKISNLQKMAETLVWVQENNINDLTELNDLCKTAQANAQAAYERLSQAEDELYKTNEQIHYAGQYLSTKEVQQQFTKAIFKKNSVQSIPRNWTPMQNP